MNYVRLDGFITNDTLTLSLYNNLDTFVTYKINVYELNKNVLVNFIDDLQRNDFVYNYMVTPDLCFVVNSDTLVIKLDKCEVNVNLNESLRLNFLNLKKQLIKLPKETFFTFFR
jgi:hypothetical protein